MSENFSLFSDKILCEKALAVFSASSTAGGPGVWALPRRWPPESTSPYILKGVLGSPWNVKTAECSSALAIPGPVSRTSSHLVCLIWQQKALRKQPWACLVCAAFTAGVLKIMHSYHTLLNLTQLQFLAEESSILDMIRHKNERRNFHSQTWTDFCKFQ